MVYVTCSLLQGINPKLEFSTSTTMQEARASPLLHYTMLTTLPGNDRQRVSSPYCLLLLCSTIVDLLINKKNEYLKVILSR